MLPFCSAETKNDWTRWARLIAENGGESKGHLDKVDKGLGLAQGKTKLQGTPQFHHFAELISR
jgi:hypothetical protein